MDFAVQSLATDKKGCIFPGTIFRILLNLVSCCGFKEGIYFSQNELSMLKVQRKQLQHYNSVATLPSTAKCRTKKFEKTPETSSMLASSMPCIFQHRRLTDSDNNSEKCLFQAFHKWCWIHSQICNHSCFHRFMPCDTIHCFLFLPSGWNIKLEN